MRILLILLPFLLAGCAKPQQDIGAQYEQAAIIACGNFTYDDVTRKNVMQRYNCLSNLQKRMLVPSQPYPDLFLQAIALRGVSAEKFQNGKISKQEFLAYGTQIQSAVITESRNRQLQEIQAASPQPVYVPQVPTLQIPQNPNRIHCTTYRSGVYNDIDCR